MEKGPIMPIFISMSDHNIPPIEERLTYNTYKEGDKEVRTELKNLGRGYCCGSGCRHCPYWPKYQYQNRSIKPSIKELFDQIWDIDGE